MMLIDQPHRIIASDETWQEFLDEMQAALDRAEDDEDIDEIERYIALAEDVLRERAQQTERKDWDESEHPRDEDGKFTFSGGGGGSAEEDAAAAAAEPERPPAEPNAEVLSVGGDEWNKATAERLEREYVSARDSLDKIASEAAGSDVEQPPDEDESEDDKVFVPDEWGSMSSDQQTEAEDAYKKQTYQDYFDSEVENWYSEYAEDEARGKVAEDFTDGTETDWAADAVAGWREDWEANNDSKISFTDDQLVEALTVEHETGNGSYQLDKYTEIDIDDSKLGLPPGFGEEEPSLPGVEPPEPGFPDTEQRQSLIDAVEAAFKKQADHVKDHMDPPDYLGDSVAEFQEESWSSMDDKDKFSWVEHNTNIISDLQEEADKYGESKLPEEIDKLPDTFDPLEQHVTSHGQNLDYKRTQLLARHMSVERAAQIMVERKIIEPDEIGDARDEIRTLDAKLWNGWKGSSHSDQGKLLQVAAAEELGGRLRETSIPRAEVIDLANKNYAEIKGFEGIKAYIRAKWETTQYLLDKADIQTVQVFRAISLQTTAPATIKQSGDKWEVYDKDGKLSGTFDTEQAAKDHKFELDDAAGPNAAATEEVEAPTGDYAGTAYNKIPDLKVVRNGLASTTTDPGVANGWGNTSSRVVLRAEVPRTAVLSVPAYGINIQKEHEVVVAGTAWKAWDAWKERAPTFDAVPMKAAA